MIYLNTMDTNHSRQKQPTFRQLKRRKEFHEIKEIASRLEYRDLIKNNYCYKEWHKNGWNYMGYIKKTYWADLWYLFDLLEWSRMKRHTL